MPGFFLSIILTSLMLMSAVVPHNTRFSNIAFTAIFLSVIVYVLWKAISRNSRNHRLNWMHLIATGLSCSVITAVFFSAFSFIYARDISPGYLHQLLEQSKLLWVEKNYSATAIAGQGEWEWFKTPFNFAMNNFRALMAVFAVFSVILSTIFYIRNRNNAPYHEYAQDPQLIF
jgi:hypothetical protein